MKLFSVYHFGSTWMNSDEKTEFQLDMPTRHKITGHCMCLERKQFQSKTITRSVNLLGIIKQFECSNSVSHDFTNHLHVQANDYQVTYLQKNKIVKSIWNEEKTLSTIPRKWRKILVTELFGLSKQHLVAYIVNEVNHRKRSLRLKGYKTYIYILRTK